MIGLLPEDVSTVMFAATLTGPYMSKPVFAKEILLSESLRVTAPVCPEPPIWMVANSTGTLSRKVSESERSPAPVPSPINVVSADPLKVAIPDEPPVDSRVTPLSVIVSAARNRFPEFVSILTPLERVMVVDFVTSTEDASTLPANATVAPSETVKEPIALSEAPIALSVMFADPESSVKEGFVPPSVTDAGSVIAWSVVAASVIIYESAVRPSVAEVKATVPAVATELPVVSIVPPRLMFPEPDPEFILIFPPEVVTPALTIEDPDMVTSPISPAFPIEPRETAPDPVREIVSVLLPRIPSVEIAAAFTIRLLPSDKRTSPVANSTF